MKTTLIVIVILAIAGGLVWFFGFRNSDRAKTPAAEQNTATTETTAQEEDEAGTETAIAETVGYTTAGFDPANIIVKVGDTVRFVNKSPRAMRVASDNHPTHLLYPEFDDTSGTPAGASYEFTFTKAGTWGYHDHNQPEHTGTVTVTE